MNIGLFGGSFNPIHNGHLAVAKSVFKKIDLDQIWFIPCGNHPLKDNEKLLSFSKRVLLIEKSIAIYPHFKISHLDADSEIPNFTDEMIIKARKKYHENKFFLIVGYDILPEFSKWHNFKWLGKNVHFIIVNRLNHQNYKPTEIKHFTIIDMKPVDISSTQIRNLIKNNEDISHLIPPNICKLTQQFYPQKEKK